MIYVSDLDGTLLNPQGKLTDFTIRTINELIGKGLLFTIASARSIITAADFIDKLNFTIPVILRNGAFVYDPRDDRVLMKKLLNHSQMEPVLDFFIGRGLNPIVHHTNGRDLFVDYTEIGNYGEKHYIESRLRAGDGRFRNVDRYYYDSDSEFISMCVIGDNMSQDILYESICGEFREGYIIHKYIDTYSNHTWIEINHPDATKSNAMSYIMDYLGETEFTAFGDNINDIGMLESAEIGYMPFGSHLEKAGYDFNLTKSNEEDGIAHKLLEIHK